MQHIYVTVGKFLLKTGFLLAFLFPPATDGRSSTVLTESDVLKSFVDKGVYPSLSRAAETAGRLADASQNLCAYPSDKNLQLARDAWQKAYLAWRRAEPFMFGPAEKLYQRLGKWPANNVVLNAVAASAEYRYARGEADVRGFPAAEYLLFTPKNAAEATAGERCAHLNDVTREILELVRNSRQGWERGFGKSFVSAGNGQPFLVPGDALSLAVTQIVSVTEHMLRDRIGIPSGFFKGITKPESVEAWRSGSALDGFEATLEGIRLAVTGGGNTSVARLVATKDGLVESKNPTLAADIQQQIDKIEKVIAGLGDSDRLHRDPLKLKGLYKQIQKLQDQLIEAALVLELDVRVLELDVRTQQ
jgi:predicted lipoprotein